jgi:hypothetical protein
MNRPTWHVNIGLVSPFQDVMKYTEILWNTHPVFMGHQVMNIEYISPGFNVKGGIKFRGNCCEMVANMVDECLTSPFGPSGWYGLVPLKEGIPKFQNMIVGFPKGTVILGPFNISRVLDCILRFCHKWILMWSWFYLHRQIWLIGAHVTRWVSLKMFDIPKMSSRSVWKCLNLISPKCQVGQSENVW